MTSVLTSTNNGVVIMRERNWCTATHMNETFTFRLHATAMDVLHNLRDSSEDMQNAKNTTEGNAAASNNKTSTQSPLQLLDYLTECLCYVKNFSIEHEEETRENNNDGVEDDNQKKTVQNNKDTFSTNKIRANNSINSANKYTIAKSDVLMHVAQAVYVPLEVEISMLDDANALPQETKESGEPITEIGNDQEYMFNTDVMTDKWTPFHLALLTQHRAFVKEMIEFHTRYGVWLLQQVCAFNNSTYIDEKKCQNERKFNAVRSEDHKPVKCCISSLFADTPVLLKGESGNDNYNWHKVQESNSERNDIMHTEIDRNEDIIDENNNTIVTCEIKNCLDLTVEVITCAMKPIIEVLIKEYKQIDKQIKHNDKNEDNKLQSSFLHEIVEFMQMFFGQHNYHNQLTCIIDSDVLCKWVIQEDWLHSLQCLLHLFHGALSPVLHGMAIPQSIWHHLSLLPHRPSSALRRRASNLSFCSSSNNNNSLSQNSSMDRITRSFTPVRNASFSTTHLTSTSYNNNKNNNNHVKDVENDEKKTIANCKSLEGKHENHSHPDHHKLLAKESVEYKHKEDNPLLVPLEIQHSAEAHINTSFNEHNKINVHNTAISGSFVDSTNNKCMCSDVEAFWWDCGPQEIHKLLVTAIVLECRARSIEPVGPTHLHRFSRLLHDVHRLLAIHIKLMSLVVTEHSTDKSQNNNLMINVNNNSNHAHEKNKANSTSHLTSTHEQHHFLSSLQHTNDEIIPHNTIWSTHLLLLSLWLSKECTVEKMVDLIGYENVSLVMSHPGNVPAAFILLLALGEYITSFITNLSSNSFFSNSRTNEYCVINHKRINFAEELQHIRCKINVLLSEGHQRGPSLRQFITTGLLNQSDRFRELWLEIFANNNDDDDYNNNNNYDKCVKKFKTRVEMLHYAVVERLLKSLEKMSSTRHDHSSTEENNDHESNETNNEVKVHKASHTESEIYTHEGKAAIFDYLKMWHKYFVSLEEYASKHNVYNNDSNKYTKVNEEKYNEKLLQEMKEHKQHYSQQEQQLQQQQQQLHSHFIEQNAKISTNNNTLESIPVNEKSSHENNSVNQEAQCNNDNTVCTKQEMEVNDADNNDLDDLLDESEEQVAHREVCESLHIINSRFLPRLKYGKSILPTLVVCFETHHAKHDRVLSNVSFRATNTNTNTSKEEDAKVCKKENEQSEEQHINNKDDDVHHHSNNNIPNKSEKELEDRFVYAQTEFAQFASHCSNEVKLKFYGLYKQAIDGDVNKSAPWRFDLVGRAKWDAWNALRGMSKEEAKREYITAYDTLRMSNITN